MRVHVLGKMTRQQLITAYARMRPPSSGIPLRTVVRGSDFTLPFTRDQLIAAIREAEDARPYVRNEELYGDLRGDPGFTLSGKIPERPY